MWAGLADPCDTRKALLESDPEEVLLRQLIAGWEEVAPDGEAITVIEAGGRLSRSPTLRAVFEEWEGLVGDKPKTKTLGSRISKQKDRWCHGKRIAKGNETRTGTSTWRVETLGSIAGSRSSTKTEHPAENPALFPQ